MRARGYIHFLYIHFLYIHLMFFFQSFLPDFLVDPFFSCSYTPSDLCFMPFEQVGEQNQKTLYKHYMDTGEIKNRLLTKI